MSFATALAEYRATGQAVFAAAEGAALESGAPDAGAGAEVLLARSQELERTAGLDLASGDADVRELAALQLAASSALDVAAAADLLRLDEAAVLEAEGSYFSTTYEELRGVLEAETALGARAALEAAPAEGGAALESAGVDGLRGAVEDAISGIGGNAAKIAGYAIEGLKDIPEDALLGAFGDAVDKILGRVLRRAKRLVKLAVKHLLKAASKLLRLLGPLEPIARTWLKDKLGGVTQDKLVGLAVDRLLEVGRLREELGAALDNAGSADAERLDAAREHVAGLAGRFGRHELVIRVLMKVLDKVRGWLLGVAQWVAAAVAGVYLLVIMYGVWVAGDFLDWYRTREEGRLDLVDGVRSVVLDAAGAA